MNKKIDCQSSQFAIFLQSFKAKLQEAFGEMENVEAWIYASGTSGWADALKAASEKHMPEVWTLWDQLDWWASDLFDSWLIDCAQYLGFCREEPGSDEHEQ